MAANYTLNPHRSYGHMNADARVAISAFGPFTLAFPQSLNYIAAAYFNNDGRIDIADFGQFSVRFFTMLP